MTARTFPMLTRLTTDALISIIGSVPNFYRTLTIFSQAQPGPESRCV